MVDECRVGFPATQKGQADLDREPQKSPPMSLNTPPQLSPDYLATLLVHSHPLTNSHRSPLCPSQHIGVPGEGRNADMCRPAFGQTLYVTY